MMANSSIASRLGRTDRIVVFLINGTEASAGAARPATQARFGMKESDSVAERLRESLD